MKGLDAKAMACIAKMPLTDLNLSETNMQDDDVSVMLTGKLKEDLVSLNVQGNPGIGKASVAVLLKACKRLCELELEDDLKWRDIQQTLEAEFFMRASVPPTPPVV